MPSQKWRTERSFFKKIFILHQNCIFCNLVGEQVFTFGSQFFCRNFTVTLCLFKTTVPGSSLISICQTLFHLLDFFFACFCCFPDKSQNLILAVGPPELFLLPPHHTQHLCLSEFRKRWHFLQNSVCKLVISCFLWIKNITMLSLSVSSKAMRNVIKPIKTSGKLANTVLEALSASHHEHGHTCSRCVIIREQSKKIQQQCSAHNC